MRNVSIAFLLCSIYLSNCSRTSEMKRYRLRGEIVRLDPEVHAVVIKHQKIEGWMEAMTMEFRLKNRGDLWSLHSGDRITATVFVRGFDFWIGEIHHEAPIAAAKSNGRNE